jgi:DNA-binding transcriptional MerR regulator
MDPKGFTRAEVCRMTGLSTAVLYRWECKNIIRPWKARGSSARLRYSAVHVLRIKAIRALRRSGRSLRRAVREADDWVVAQWRLTRTVNSGSPDFTKGPGGAR